MNIKKIPALLLAAVLLVCGSGCSSGQDMAQNQITETQGTAAVPEETARTQTADTAGNPGETTQPGTEPAPAQNAPLTITDAIGREVDITPGSYQRVVCIGAGALRMYCYIGDTALLCGVEDIDNTTLEERPQMFDSVARPYVIANQDVFSALDSCGVGGPNAQAAEAEKILSCSPDIVISEYEDVEKEDALQEQLGVPVITLRSGADGVFDDAFKQSMELLGTIFGKEEKAQDLTAFIDTQVAEISGRTASASGEEKPDVYICGLGNWGTTNHLMTAQNYIAFDIANVKNAVADLGQGGIQEIEEEKFVALGSDIDIMIMDAAAVKNIIPLYQEDPAIFDTCKAWQDGEVYLQMAYNAYYTNYETALANTWFIAKTVYPDLFADIDLTEKTDEITKAFLGQPLAEEIFAYPSSFGGYQKIDTQGFFQ